MKYLGYVLGAILIVFCTTVLFLIDYSIVGSIGLMLLSLLGIIIGLLVIGIEYHQNKE